MIVYIDTLALLYRAYYAIPDLTSEDGMPTGALFGLTNTLLRVIAELEPEHVVACFDRPEETFRQEMHQEYKATRELPEEEMIAQIEASRALLQALGVHTVEQAGYEADDLLGTLALADVERGERVVIVTCDGDLLQLTVHDGVRVFLLQKGMQDFVLHDAQEVEKKNGYPASRIVDYKGLAGDSSDNIRGVSGIGDVHAKKLIAAFGDLDAIYAALDASSLLEAGFTKRVVGLLESGRESAFLSRDLATIHTDVSVRGPHVRAKAWRERVDFPAAEKELLRYSFTSLVPRFADLLSHEVGEDSVAEDSVAEDSPVTISPDQESVLREAAIALWVLDASKTNASLDDVLSYAGVDSIESAHARILKDLEREGRVAVWEQIEKPLIPVIARMEEIGVLFDRQGAEKLSVQYRGILAKLGEKIHTHAGKEFNIKSPKQLSEVLYRDLSLRPKRASKTASGGRTTKESVLLEMVDDHPIIPLVLEYRHYEKLRSTYVDALPEHLDDANRLHTHLQQNGTTSGRLSSRSPNLQNIPIGGEDGTAIRNLFLTSDGWTMVSIDYAQVELRLAAILSQDEALLSIFAQGDDVHSSVAARVFSVAEDAVTSDQRSKAKTINFSILYGAGAHSLARSLGVSPTEASSFLEEYKGAFPALFAYMDALKQEAAVAGHVTTAFGRVRPIPGITSSLSFVRAQAERVAANTVIQGTAADVIKLAMIAIADYLEQEKLHDSVRMLLQIHDELLFEVRPSVFDAVVPRIVSLMESVYPPDGKPIPLSVEAGSGRAWGSLR